MRAFSAVLGIFFISTVSVAGTTGKVAGEVKDASTGEAAVGATVTIEGTTLGAAADIEGYYVILNVPPGTYTLNVSSVGYVKKAVTEVVVRVDLTTTVNVEISETVLEVGEEVVVTSERL